MSTTSQINRLGERLRKDKPTASDQEALEAFRRSFNDALRVVVDALLSLGLAPTERIKSSFSIVRKLQRESIRLSRLQDIAGCRIIVKGISDQNHFTKRIQEALPKSALIDRRDKPMHGYRAIHIVADIDEKFVEIQVRTELQHLWAAWSEALATALDQSIKYGGGPPEFRRILELQAGTVALLESQEESTRVGFDLLGQMGLPPSLDALIEKLSEAALQPELVMAQRFLISTFELEVQERTLKDRLIREIASLKRKRPEQ